MRCLFIVVYSIFEIVFRLFYSIIRLGYEIVKGVVRIYARRTGIDKTAAPSTQ